MTKTEARRMAYSNAAAWLAKDADSADIDVDTDADDEEVRKVIREEIVVFLENRAKFYQAKI